MANNISAKYDEYVAKYKNENKKFNMQNMYSKEEFAEVYKDLVKQQSTKVSERDGGTASIIHGKLTNYLVQSQRLGSYEVASEMRRRAEADSESFGKFKITDFTKPDLSEWEGKVVTGTNKKGMKYKYTMTKTNAWFAYMSAIGMRQSAEENYGY